MNVKFRSMSFRRVHTHKKLRASEQKMTTSKIIIAEALLFTNKEEHRVFCVTFCDSVTSISFTFFGAQRETLLAACR